MRRSVPRTGLIARNSQKKARNQTSSNVLHGMFQILWFCVSSKGRKSLICVDDLASSRLVRNFNCTCGVTKMLSKNFCSHRLLLWPYVDDCRRSRGPSWKMFCSSLRLLTTSSKTWFLQAKCVFIFTFCILETVALLCVVI